MSRSLFDPNVVRSIQENLSKNCLSYWFPILEKSGVRVPKTVIIKTEVELGQLVDGVTPNGFVDFIEKEIKPAALSISKDGPWFLRTGMLSGKHDWIKTCYLDSFHELPYHVANLVEESALCDMLGRPFDVWVVREFIPMESAFTAFNGLPINKERRYFIKDGEVICHHSYWPESAIAKDPPKDYLFWKEKLAHLNFEGQSELFILASIAREISKHFEGAWSLDLSLGKDYQWYAIDMAVAEDSWHDPDCPNSPDSPL